MTAVKDKQIEGLREQLAAKQTTLDKLLPCFESCKKSLMNIEVMLGTLKEGTKGSVVGITSTSTTAAAQPNNLNTTVASIAPGPSALPSVPSGSQRKLP